MISPYCTIAPGNSSINTADGFSLTLAISFPASFTGAHSVYSFGTNRKGLSSAWTPLGVLSVGTTSTNYSLIAPSPQTVSDGVPAAVSYSIAVTGNPGAVSFTATGCPRAPPGRSIRRALPGLALLR